MNNDSDLNGILQRIIVEPDVDLHRLVYADRLEELGEHDKAKFIRGSIENKGRGFECYSHPQHYDVGFDVVPAGFDRTCEYERGFIEMWITDAAAFLRHADSLVWHPTQTISDPTPFMLSRNEAETLSRSNEVRDYLMMSRTALEDIASRAAEYGLPKRFYGVPIEVDIDRTCERIDVLRAIKERAKKHVPRPCPPTAQPIRRVVLTTSPESTGRINEFALWKKMSEGEPWRSHRWPEVEFVLPTGTEAASDDNEIEDNYNVLSNS